MSAHEPGNGPAERITPEASIFADPNKFREVLQQAQTGDSRPVGRSRAGSSQQAASGSRRTPTRPTKPASPAPAWVRLEDVLRTTAAAEECLRNAGASYAEKQEPAQPLRLNAEAAAAQEAAMRDVREFRVSFFNALPVSSPPVQSTDD